MPAKTLLSSKYLPEPMSGCWLWMGCYSLESGYGYVRLNGKMTQSHRAVYMAAGRTIPKGAHLDHLCKNRACVNPDHLEPVTCAVNLRRGANTKLNVRTIEELRAKSMHGISNRTLAVEYGISEAMASMIISNKRWKGELSCQRQQ